jgi:hypothetical protein
VDPRISIIVEWENVILAGAPRARAMLARLAGEARCCEEPLEILFCHPGADPPELAEAGAALPPVCRFVAASGAHYYELKNVAAAEARGAILVFLDSDVIPAEGWLQALLAPFADPAVQVVAGHSTIDAENLYSRAFALTWFFPLPAGPAPLQPVPRFFANNVAFRREVFLAHPFSALEGTSRGACVRLAQELGRQGITIWKTTAARVTHPAPRGFRHFLLRGLAEGRDRILPERGWRATPLATAARWLRNCLAGLVSILLRHRRVGLSPAGIPAAAAICFAYYSLYAAGELGAWLGLKAVRRIQV